MVDRTHALVLEPAGYVLESGAAQPRRRVLGARIVPRSPPVGEVPRVRLLTSNLIGQVAKGVDVPVSAALRHEPAPRLQGPAKRREQRIVVVDPMEGRVGERHVDGLGQVELDQVLTEDGRPLSQRLPGVLGHRRCDVHPEHPPARHPVGQLRRDAATAAAGVEHDLVSLQRKPLELLERPHQLHVAGDAIVCGRVPVPRSGRSAHNAVVTGPGRSRSRS